MQYLSLLAALLLVTAGCTQSYTVTHTASGRQQIVNPVNDNLLQGTEPDFANVIVALDADRGWLLTVYEYNDTTSPLYPYAVFGQLTPDPNSPEGRSGRLINGKINQDASPFRVSAGSP